MSILLALLAALGFGTGDFFAGIASRRVDFRIVAAAAQLVALAAALVAVLAFSGAGPTGRVVLWGAIAGVGNAVGAMMLYHGLSIGRMSIVATLSGVLASVIPVLVGLIQGDSLSAMSAAGIALAIPAIALVSWQPAAVDEGAAGSSGAIWGLLAGAGFALFFVALDHAGNDSGAWPVAFNQMAAVLIVVPLAARVIVTQRARVSRPDVAITLAAAAALALATILLQAAFHEGELAIVVVLTSLYPGVTTLLARFALDEHWVATQKLGLATALAAVVLVSAGTA